MTRCVITFDKLNVSTDLTLLQVLAGTNREIRITEVGISFQGVDNLGMPILVELLRQTTAGTATPRTIAKVDESDSNAIDASGQTVFTVEPTASDVLRTWLIHPQRGIVYVVPEPARFTVAGGARLGLRVVSPDDAVDCVGYMEFEE